MVGIETFSTLPCIVLLVGKKLDLPELLVISVRRDVFHRNETPRVEHSTNIVDAEVVSTNPEKIRVLCTPGRSHTFTRLNRVYRNVGTNCVSNFTIRKREATTLIRYGVRNAMQNAEIYAKNRRSAYVYTFNHKN